MSTGNINLMYRQKYINSFLPVKLKNKSFKMFPDCKYPESVLYSSPSLQDLCKSAGISTFPRTKWYGGKDIGLDLFYMHSLSITLYLLLNFVFSTLASRIGGKFANYIIFGQLLVLLDRCLICSGISICIFFSLILIFWTMISRLIHFVALAVAITDSNIHEAGEGKITPHSLDRSQSPITVKLARLTLTRLQSQYSNQPHHTQQTQL